MFLASNFLLTSSVTFDVGLFLSTKRSEKANCRNYFQGRSDGGGISVYIAPNQSTLIFYVVVLSPWPRTNSFIPTQIKFLTTPLTAMLLLRHIPNSGDARLNSCSQWFRRQQKRNVVVLSTCTICQVSTWTVSLCLAADWAHTAVGRSTTLARQSGTRCQMNLEIETVCQFR